MTFYTYYKIDVLRSKKSVDILSVVKEDNFSEEDSFGVNQGLNIALTLYDSSNEQFFAIDPAYGRLRIAKHKYQFLNHGKVERQSYELKTHKCTLEELGLATDINNDDAKPAFMPIFEAQKNFLRSASS